MNNSRGLRALASSYWTGLDPESGTKLLELKITDADLNEIKSEHFHGIRGLKHLDLSENKFEEIADDAFEEVTSSIVRCSVAPAICSY